MFRVDDVRAISTCSSYRRCVHRCLKSKIRKLNDALISVQKKRDTLSFARDWVFLNTQLIKETIIKTTTWSKKKSINDQLNVNWLKKRSQRRLRDRKHVDQRSIDVNWLKKRSQKRLRDRKKKTSINDQLISTDWNHLMSIN